MDVSGGGTQQPSFAEHVIPRAAQLESSSALHCSPGGASMVLWLYQLRRPLFLKHRRTFPRCASTVLARCGILLLMAVASVRSKRSQCAEQVEVHYGLLRLTGGGI